MQRREEYFLIISLGWVSTVYPELLLMRGNLFDAMSLTEFSFLQLILQLGFYNLILDQCRVMREMECCLLVWVSSTSFQTLLDIGGDELLSPCLGLYYLLSGLRRILGEMYAASLSGSLLPAFRPCWIMGRWNVVS